MEFNVQGMHYCMYVMKCTIIYAYRGLQVAYNSLRTSFSLAMM